MQDRTQNRENRQESLRTLLRSRIGSFVYSGIHLSHSIRTNERRRLLPASGRSRPTSKNRRSLRYTSDRLVFAGAHFFLEGANVTMCRRSAQDRKSSHRRSILDTRSFY